MSKDHDPIFSPAWERDEHELAFREMMDRMAQVSEEPAPYGRLLDIGDRVVLTDYEMLEFEMWKHQQE